MIWPALMKNNIGQERIVNKSPNLKKLTTMPFSALLIRNSGYKLQIE